MSAALAVETDTEGFLAHLAREASIPTFERPSDRESILQVWRGRIRFRQQLWRLLRDSPTLIEDIGLTVEQAKEELAKPFWRRSCDGLSRRGASLAQRFNEPSIA